MRPAEELTRLEQAVDRLLTQKQELEAELSRLQTEVARQHDEIVATHTELGNLKATYLKLRDAHALLVDSTDPDMQLARDRAKRHITALIEKINRAEELLLAEKQQDLS